MYDLGKKAEAMVTLMQEMFGVETNADALNRLIVLGNLIRENREMETNYIYVGDRQIFLDK